MNKKIVAAMMAVAMTAVTFPALAGYWSGHTETVGTWSWNSDLVQRLFEALGIV